MMSQESRVSKSLKNAKVSTFFYFIFLFLSFFSRKIFLEHLGAEFLGLTGTLGNILGFLSLAELGVGTATAFNLYKPLQENDRNRVNELISVFGFLYRRIGVLIFIGAIILCAFFPLIFKSIDSPLFLVYFTFLSLLYSSLIEYFINFRQVLLTADQKGYVVTGYLKGASFVKILIQMALALSWGNLYAYVTIEIIFSTIACIILNKRIDKEYDWLDISIKKGRDALPTNTALIANIKQVFIHKFSGFVLRQSDQVFIFAFVSLKMVAYYGNYTIIVDKLSQAVNSVLGSFWAGVGNLIAEGNKQRIKTVYWEIMSLRFIVGGIIVFCVFHLVDPFISLWIGDSYILDRSILNLLLITVFIDQTRGTTEMFKEGYGLFNDTWAPLTEALINISVTLVLAPHMGICGLLLGKITSLCLIVLFWKPYYLFKMGFKESVWNYWKEYAKYLLAFATSSIVCHYIIALIEFSKLDFGAFTCWIITALTTFVLFTTFYLSILYLGTNGTRTFFHRVKSLIIHA